MNKNNYDLQEYDFNQREPTDEDRAAVQEIMDNYHKHERQPPKPSPLLTVGCGILLLLFIVVALWVVWEMFRAGYGL